MRFYSVSISSLVKVTHKLKKSFQNLFNSFSLLSQIFRGGGGGSMLGDVNISAILDSFSVSYDKRVRPNYGGMYNFTFKNSSIVTQRKFVSNYLKY